MIAVVYSGSRYASWKLADKGHLLCEFKTPGINPYFNDEKSISILLNKTNELITYAEKIKKIYFFGAGASSTEYKSLISTAFGSFFRYGKVVVEHDLKAAALATCADHAGLVGIIGSGSNAGYYNGNKLKETNYGLGYIIGDEGSSNWMGKRLLKDFLEETMPEDFRKKFTKKYPFDRKMILDKVYKQPQPVLFLSSFSAFLRDNSTSDYVKTMVQEGFSLYFENYMIPLAAAYPWTPIHFVGTMAASFEDWLREIALKNDLHVSSVIKAPIYNVLNYYTNKN